MVIQTVYGLDCEHVGMYSNSIFTKKIALRKIRVVI